jgi:hypothetical protein
MLLQAGNRNANRPLQRHLSLGRGSRCFRRRRREYHHASVSSGDFEQWRVARLRGLEGL